MTMMKALFLILPLFTTALSAGLKCEEHPGFVPGMKPVFVYAFSKLEGHPHTWMNYHPRYTKHHWAPLDDPSSKKYYGLDWFWANGDDEAAGSSAYVRLFLQRPAKVYLAVAVRWDRNMPVGSLPGWKPEGYAERPKDGEGFVAGIFQKHEKYLPPYMFIFSKMADTVIDLPEGRWIQKNARGVTAEAHWYAMLAEPNGDAPVAPTKSSAVTGDIKPNEPCPASLHDLWVTENTDDSDPDTRGKKWRTWHPHWDPCYWCGYDHEHGSSPKHFMNYEPKYELVAWKNNREDESHEGFKGHVVKVGPHLIYWSLHVQTSRLRRVRTRFHTVTLAIADAKTKELLVEVAHKGFFGFLSARAPITGGFLPLSPRENALKESLAGQDGARNRRSVNVININNLDPRFSYRSPRIPSQVLRGEYEDWTTGPICGGRGRNGMIAVDTTNPATGIKSMESKEKVLLGMEWNGMFEKFRKHEGSERIVFLTDFQFGYDNCAFHLKNMKGSMPANGVFYTDAKGTTMMDGPSPTSVRQFVKPGFKFRMDNMNVFQPKEPWFGEYELEGSRGISSYGFVIDPSKN